MYASRILTGCLAALCAIAAPALPALRAQEDAKQEQPKPLVSEQGKLTDDDPRDKLIQKSPHKVHEIKLEAGKTYRIDMTSNEIDSYLRLEDKDGKRLAQDDDGGGFPHARIIFKATEDETYRVIATCFPGGKQLAGAYTLSVNLASPADLLELRVRNLGTASIKDRNETINELTKYLRAQGKELTVKDLQLARGAAMSIERQAPKQAAALYSDFGKIFEDSPNPIIAKSAKQFAGCARRLNLPGNTMEIKGATLDGKEFDLAGMKGKVVLVDFWATWCGPCIAEIPGMTKMYNAYKDRGFEIIGVSVDADREKLDSFLERRKLPWPQIHDARGEGKETLSDHYGVMFIPLPILVDRDGKVVSMNARGRELEQLLEKHIGPVEPETK
jgi:thiol-disulfide isomerase/thioredoxin